uniref:Uncharacterized protein n=1 Tax=Talaromyces marneffei PM1 TaxID=1077442 RepID=A0A093VEG7_TALMA
MISRTALGLTATLALFSRSAFAANATTITATGCVDSSGMSTCLNTAETKYESCMSVAGGNNEVVIACQWTQWVDQMLCYQTSCWNKIYSCEYQFLVSEYLSEQTASAKIPYYPAPDNAPGGCSCNLGEVLNNVTANVNAAGSTCSKYVNGISNDIFTCECCGWSAAVSAFYGICPGTSPDGLGYSAFDSQAANFEKFSGSCAGLTSEICAQYGIYSADNGTFLDPTALPAAGTNALSTTAGPSSLTSPPAGETITWTLASQTFTVTAAPYNARDVGGSTVTGTAAPATGVQAMVLQELRPRVPQVRLPLQEQY